MAHAVEGRFPFLDHRVVAFAAGLPPRLKLRGLTEKYLLRRSVGRDLPPALGLQFVKGLLLGPHELLEPLLEFVGGTFAEGEVKRPEIVVVVHDAP